MSNSRPKQQAIVYCKSKNYASGSLEEGTAIDAYITAYKQAERDYGELLYVTINAYSAWMGGTIEDVRITMHDLGEILENKFKNAMSEL